MTFTRLFLLLAIASTTLFGQGFTWGVKLGAPVKGLLDASGDYSADTTPITVGPTAEVLLPFGLSVEVDGLYKRFSYERTTGQVVNSGAEGNSWEFPLLLKLRSPGLVVRPYVDAGFSFRTFQGLSKFGTDLLPGGDPPELRDNSSRGVVVGAGLQLRVPFVRISPEIRYTRWGSRAFESTNGALESTRNQFDFLVGFTF